MSTHNPLHDIQRAFDRLTEVIICHPDDAPTIRAQLAGRAGWELHESDGCLPGKVLHYNKGAVWDSLEASFAPPFFGPERTVGVPVAPAPPIFSFSEDPDDSHRP